MWIWGDKSIQSVASGISCLVNSSASPSPEDRASAAKAIFPVSGPVAYPLTEDRAGFVLFLAFSVF